MTTSVRVGDRFGSYTVEALSSKYVKYMRYWECRCECGNIRTVTENNLVRGKAKSCGCTRSELTTKRNTTHGMTGTRLYRIWNDMIRRCDDPSRQSYRNYGGRGIRYHPSFRTFEGFLAGIPDGYNEYVTIDRIDVDGDYEPGNLRWATDDEQRRNKRNNHLVELGDGVRRTIADASRMFGVPQRVISDRLSRDWNHFDAITIPVGRAIRRR